MPHNRYYHPHPLKSGHKITLSPEESRHLTAVMKGRPKDRIEICNGQGTLAQAELIAPSKSASICKILSSEEENSPLPQITLYLALSQPAHLEMAVEKCTELGVAHFALFPAERSLKKQLNSNQRKRLEKITIASMKQCGRLTLPTLETLPPIDKWSCFTKTCYLTSLESNLPPLYTKPPGDVLIGPEGGWTEEEYRKALQLGAIPVTLHPHILRTETAAIVAASYAMR